MAYITSGTIGVNLTRTTAGTTTDGANAEFALGTTHAGNNGSRWCYVQANGAITQYAFVGIDENFQAVALTHALATAGYKIAAAQVAFADNDLGWVQIDGPSSGLLLINCAADVPLYTQASAGYLDDASVTSSVKLDGVVCYSTITASTNGSLIMSFPRSTTI